MSLCPLCERQLLRTGAYLASSDYDGQWFTFAICADCRQRQARLPRQARQRQDITAAHKVIKRPDRYEVSIWQSGDEAKLYARLSADALLRSAPLGAAPARARPDADGIIGSK